MRNKYILLTALFFITASAGHAGGNVKDTAVPTINEFILPNGIKVIHQEINENPIASIEVFLKGGIINESQKQAGIANLTQTLMTQGTKTRNSETLAVELENREARRVPLGLDPLALAGGERLDHRVPFVGQDKQLQ